MIRTTSLSYRYAEGGFELRPPDLQIARGEKVAFIGPSGSGKTTLIYLLAGILEPAAGSVHVGGVDLDRLNDEGRRNFRISRIGFVFQEFELLEYLSVQENILLPCFLNATLELTPGIRDVCRDLAASMNLEDKLQRFPGTLSQGERQRVAICRSLVASPDILIADEPTGSLDPPTADTIMEILIGEVEQRKATLLMVTHNRSLLDAFDRVVDLGDPQAGGNR